MSKNIAKWLILDSQSLEALGPALTAKLVYAGGLAKTPNGLQIADEGILSGMIANAAVTDSKLASIFINTDGSVAFTSDQSMGGNILTNVASPTEISDLTNKSYTDMMAQGYAPLPSVKVATTENITLSGAQTIDDVTSLADGDLVLVKDQTVDTENGIYVYNSAGAWERAEFLDGTPEHEVRAGLTTFVEEGVTLRGSGWTIVGLANEILEIGVDTLNFVKVSRFNDWILDNDNLYIQNKKIIGIKEGGVGSHELDLSDNYAFSGAITVPTQYFGDSNGLIASTEFVHAAITDSLAGYIISEKKQITHTITSGDIIAGGFELPDNDFTEQPEIVQVWAAHGSVAFVNKLTNVDGVYPDFEVLSGTTIRFIGEDVGYNQLEEGDSVIVTYHVNQSYDTTEGYFQMIEQQADEDNPNDEILWECTESCDGS